MAILKTSELQKRRLLGVLSKDGTQERYSAREDARAVRALASKLTAPRYEDRIEEDNPELTDKLVLVFDDPTRPPLEVTIPPLDVDMPPPLIMAPPQTEEKRLMREQRRAALRAELADLIRAAGKRGFLIVGEGLDDHPDDDGTLDAKGERVFVNAEGKRVSREDPDAREAVLDPDECALAAYRALIAGAGPTAPTKSSAHVDPNRVTRLRGDHGALQTWAVVTVEDGRRVRRVYIGTEGALRRNFPDLDELARMRAAGITGAPEFNYHGPQGLTDGLGADAVRESLPRLAAGFLEPIGHTMPPTPVRIQRIAYHPED